MNDKVSNFETAVAAYQENVNIKDISFHQSREEYSQQINDIAYLRISAIGYVASYHTRRQILA